MVYFVNFNTTVIVVPKPMRLYLGNTVDLGKQNQLTVKDNAGNIIMSITDMFMRKLS